MSTRSRRSSADVRASRILARVRAIPEGFVQTYGDIEPQAPRLVGHVLATARDDVPWRRVVRADGSVPMGTDQLQQLRDEGVPIRGDRVDLANARAIMTRSLSQASPARDAQRVPPKPPSTA
jgi:alkylated DNA nucleotide flippase Atl1